MPQTQTTPESTSTTVDLSNAPCMAVLSCTDLERSRDFFGTTLGLNVTESDENGFRLQAGNNTHLYVYHREAPPMAENTVANFVVRDIEACVRSLRDAGVEIQEYELPGIKTKNGIATIGDTRSAWFTDPDGNILAVSDS